MVEVNNRTPLLDLIKKYGKNVVEKALAKSVSRRLDYTCHARRRLIIDPLLPDDYTNNERVAKYGVGDSSVEYCYVEMYNEANNVIQIMQKWAKTGNYFRDIPVMPWHYVFKNYNYLKPSQSFADAIFLKALEIESKMFFGAISHYTSRNDSITRVPRERFPEYIKAIYSYPYLVCGSDALELLRLHDKMGKCTLDETTRWEMYDIGNVGTFWFGNDYDRSPKMQVMNEAIQGISSINRNICFAFKEPEYTGVFPIRGDLVVSIGDSDIIVKESVGMGILGKDAVIRITAD